MSVATAEETGWNPWTLIRTVNPLFYLTYAASSILIGTFAALAGVVGFIALPWVAHQVSDWERHRVTILGLPPIPPSDKPFREPWLWSSDVDIRELGGWALSGLFAVLTSIAAIVCLMAGAMGVAVGAGSREPIQTLLALVIFAIAVALTLMAAAGVSGWQASLVRRILAPSDESRQVAELTDSRARIVDGFEVERRRIERDLHDGAQQYLVASSMKAGEAAYVLAELPRTDPRVARALALLGAAQDDADAALKALRETVAGIHPKVLSDRGLEAAVRDIAARQTADVSVRVGHPLATVAPGSAAAAYFLVAECLTNAAKHAAGAPVEVWLVTGDRLQVAVTDRGLGGACVREGGGLAGLQERFAALGGRVTVSSPPGGPTRVSGELPLGAS